MFHLLLGVPGLGRLKLAFDHCAIMSRHATTEWPGIRTPHQRWTLLHHNDTSHLAPAHENDLSNIYPR